MPTMEPGSLALSITGKFKEIYLVTQFLTATLTSERTLMHGWRVGVSFRSMDMYLESLYKLLLSDQALLHDKALGEKWLVHFQKILGRLWKACSEYSFFATKYDAAYQRYTSAGDPSKEIDMNIGMHSYYGQTIGQEMGSMLSAKNLSHTLSDFVELTNRLNDLMFLLLAVHPRFARSTKTDLESLAKLNDSGSNQNGLSTAASIRLSIANPPSQEDFDRLHLHGYSLTGIWRYESVIMAHPQKDGAKERSTKAIVEHKQYEHVQSSHYSNYLEGLERKVCHLSMFLSSPKISSLQTLRCRGYIY